MAVLKPILLHLLPGAVTVTAFVVVAPSFNARGYPSNLAFLLSVAFVLVPFELGWLLYQGWNRNRRVSLAGIVLYRERMPVRPFLALVVALVLFSNFVLVVLYPPVAHFLTRDVFSWLPSWYDLAPSAASSRSALLATAAFGLLINGFVAPIVEELYFRGYLLPRMAALGRWAPAANVGLHSLYHLWIPWQIPGLFVAALPVAYAVWWKRNVYLGISVHVIGNVMGSLLTIAIIVLAH